MSSRDLVRALCTSVKRGKFEPWIFDELSEVDDATFPVDKVFADIRHTCGLPPFRQNVRPGGKSTVLAEDQAACVVKYLRRMLDLFEHQHFHVWYGDLLYYLGTTHLALAADDSDLVQVLATKDVLMLKLLLEYYMRSPSAVAATILASVGDAQAETFFAELNGYIAHPQTRLNALGLLNQVTKRQGPNLHKVASSGVFNSLLLCLKNDRDIMVVTHALVSLTMLLPCLCSFLGPNLSELFGILLRLLQWRTLSSREDSDKTDFAISEAMPIAMPLPAHGHGQGHGGEKHANAGVPAMAQPPAPIIHLPLNPPVGPQHPQAGGNMGGEVNGGPGQQPHARGGQDKSAPHTGLSTPTALDGSNAPTPAPDRQIVPENRWMVLYETYPPELMHGEGYGALCQKLYGVLFVYFQHLYGTFPNNLFNFLHTNMQMDEDLRELLRPFLRSVRLNDVLVGMTAEQELDPQRWRKRDANDIVAECIWLSCGADDISVHSGSVDAANTLVDDIAKTYGASVASAASAIAVRRAKSASSSLAKSDQGISPTTTLSGSSLAGGDALARAQQIGQDMMSAAPPVGLFGAAFENERRPYYANQLNSTPSTPPSVNLPEYWGRPGSFDKPYSQSPLAPEPGHKKQRSVQLSVSGEVHSVFPLPSNLAEDSSPGNGNHVDDKAQQSGRDLLAENGARGMHPHTKYEDYAYLDKYTAGSVVMGRGARQHEKSSREMGSLSPGENVPSTSGRHRSAEEGGEKRGPVLEPTDRQLNMERQQHRFPPGFGVGAPDDDHHDHHHPRQHDRRTHQSKPSSSSDVAAEVEMENALMQKIHDLESQIDMIKAELVFEQYLKEQHIQRTRRLRRENMNIQAFQMEHTSMLVGMEKEFKALQATYTRLLDDHSRMQRQHERWERDLQAKLQKYKTENAGLAARNITLQEQHDILEGHMADLRRQLDSAHADIILLNNRCKETASRAVGFKDLEAQIRILQAELEAKDLQLEQYEEAEKRRQQADTQEQNTTLLLESYQQESKYLKGALQAANSKLGEYTARIQHLQTQLDHKELAYKEQSKMLQTVKGMSEQRLRAVEDKYDALKAVNYALETRMLDLYIAKDTPAHSLRLSDNEPRQREYEAKSRERTAPTTPVLETQQRPDSRP